GMLKAWGAVLGMVATPGASRWVLTTPGASRCMLTTRGASRCMLVGAFGMLASHQEVKTNIQRMAVKASTFKGRLSKRQHSKNGLPSANTTGRGPPGGTTPGKAFYGMLTSPEASRSMLVAAFGMLARHQQVKTNIQRVAV